MEIEDYPSLSKFLRSVSELDAKDYIVAYANCLAQNVTPKRIRYNAQGFHETSFTQEITVPMIALRVLACLTNGMTSNYNACRLLSIPLRPRSLPQPRVEFKYVFEKNEIPLAEEGGIRNMTGAGIRSRAEMTVGLTSMSMTTVACRAETVQRALPAELRAEIASTVESTTAGWQANIALAHFRYAAAQPRLSELVVLRNAEYQASRDHVSAFIDLLNVENCVEGSLNRDLNFFPQLVVSALRSVAQEDNRFVLIVPKNLALDCVNTTVEVTLPHHEVFYDTSGALDSNNHVVDVDWSHDVVAYQAKMEVVQRVGKRALDGYAAAQAAGADAKPNVVVLPGIGVGDSTLPVIVLDDKPFGIDKPSMQSPFVTHNTKRLCYTVGAVPPSYRDLMNNAFFLGAGPVTPSDVASRSARVTSIVNYDESAHVNEVRLQDLHRYANREESFSHRTYRRAMANLPELEDDVNGGYVRELEEVYFNADNKSRLEHRLCVYETNPRCVTFPVLEYTAGGARATTMHLPRMCLGNASFLVSPETDVVSTLSGMLTHIPNHQPLDVYVRHAAGGFQNYTVESLYWAVFCRAVVRCRFTQNDFNAWCADVENDILAGRATGRGDFDAWIPQNHLQLKYVFLLLRHVSFTRGETLCAADPVCALALINLVHWCSAGPMPQLVGEYMSTVLQQSDLGYLNDMCCMIKSGQTAFMEFVDNTHTLAAAVWPYQLDVIGDLTDDQERFCSAFMSFFGGVWCNVEAVIRCANAAGAGGHAFSSLHAHTSPDNILTAYFDPVSGAFVAAPDGTTAKVEVFVFSESIFYRGPASALEAVNAKLMRDDVGIVLNVNLRFPSGAAVAANTLQLFDVSPVRLPNGPGEHFYVVDKVNTDPNRQCAPIAHTFATVMQPMWHVRRKMIRELFAAKPLFMLYLQAHYMTVYSYHNVVKNFDKHYHSGLSYLCVRTMEYDGYSMGVMPMGGSFFATGNITLQAATTQNYNQSLNVVMDMAVLPGHGGKHGVVLPNVFVGQVTGVNSIFISGDAAVPDDRLAQERRKTALNHMTLVLDWHSSLLPPTNAGRSNTCEAAVPVAGRYIPFRLESPQPFQTPDYSGRFCESPTLLPFSESVLRLHALASELGADARPVHEFLAASALDQVGGAVLDDIFGSPNRDKLLADLLKRATGLRALSTPFSTVNSMMFFDSYVVGAHGGLYLTRDYKSVRGEAEAGFMLNPRVIGESLGPTHLYSPATSGHFLTRFCKMFNIPYMPGAINTRAGAPGDLTVLSTRQI